jgi:hypothetical protein
MALLWGIVCNGTQLRCRFASSLFDSSGKFLAQSFNDREIKSCCIDHKKFLNISKILLLR